nr:MAG TPA: hypothetical protein [Bacteriophage sp.]
MHIFSLELLFAFVFVTIIRYFSSSCFLPLFIVRSSSLYSVILYHTRFEKVV